MIKASSSGNKQKNQYRTNDFIPFGTENRSRKANPVYPIICTNNVAPKLNANHTSFCSGSCSSAICKEPPLVVLTGFTLCMMIASYRNRKHKNEVDEKKFCGVLKSSDGGRSLGVIKNVKPHAHQNFACQMCGGMCRLKEHHVKELYFQF